MAILPLKTTNRGPAPCLPVTSFHKRRRLRSPASCGSPPLSRTLFKVSCRSESSLVYAVEFSHRSGRDLLNMAKKRTNVVPIIEDARHPHKYRMLIPMVDCVFADVAQPDQARIVALNSQFFL